MKQIKHIIIVCCFISLLAACSKSSETIIDNENSVGTSGRALDKLAKGINLNNWFNDFSDKSQFATRYNANHFASIKAAGFTYVRLPIGPAILCDPTNIAQIQPASLALVDQAVKNITSAGLSVMLDIHAYGDAFEIKLATEPTTRSSFRLFWKNLATYFKKYDTTQVFFEVWNEPHVGAAQAVAGIDKNWWMPFQGQIIQSIRESAPDHYIVAGAENWNSWYDLTFIQPYNSKNIVYNFHFYDPYIFTHQGADWSGPPYSNLRNVPYPANPQNVSALITTTTPTDIKNLLNWYGGQKYNSDSINYAIRYVYNWGLNKNVPVICNEFGVYRVYAPADSRLKYHQDVRNTLVKYKMGWAVWEYDEGFGIAEYPTSTRTGVPAWNSSIITALGLQ
jgi:aryl-phospho-beta-D-glucosidase BglC (GH1 family)